jgi:hypothetical protein
MPEVHSELVDVSIHSPRTKMRGVMALNVEMRPWLAGFPVCKALNQYQILHVGFHETYAPMRIVRTKQTTTYFLACIGGRGKVLIDGRWRICKEGFACLLPAHTLNAFEAIPGGKWEFCWVCYQRPAEQRPIADVTSPVMARFEPLPLKSAILGLMHECNGPGQPTLMQEWADLIHAYVLRFAQPSDQPDALRLLWERVAGHLGELWTLAKLAREAGYSNEHLRACAGGAKMRPDAPVTYLRRRAAELLATPSTPSKPSRTTSVIRILSLSNAFTNGSAGGLHSIAVSLPSRARNQRAHPISANGSSGRANARGLKV